MERTSGRPAIKIGLIDGPVLVSHADLAKNIQELSTNTKNGEPSDNGAFAHGTFIAGILAAKRESPAPAICPDCMLLVRPIMIAGPSDNTYALQASPLALASAILDCVAAGAHIINLSLALVPPSLTDEPQLQEALDEAARRGVIVVAAAGNQGILGGTTITRHGWVMPVVSVDMKARPMADSNLGNSISRRGLGGPGEGIISLGVKGKSEIGGGTSAAAAFVTGAVALLWSEFPGASAPEIKYAVSQFHAARRTSVIPPLLDAWAAYQYLRATHERKEMRGK